MSNYSNSTTVYFLGDDIEVNYNYKPARPAPVAYCSEQDGFDDEGDAEELEYEVNHGYPVIKEFLEDNNEDFYQSLLEEIRS